MNEVCWSEMGYTEKPVSEGTPPHLTATHHAGIVPLLVK